MFYLTTIKQWKSVRGDWTVLLCFHGGGLDESSTGFQRDFRVGWGSPVCWSLRWSC